MTIPAERLEQILHRFSELEARLASGTLDFLMRSRRAGHRRIETPELEVSYRAPERSVFCRGSGS